MTSRIGDTGRTTEALDNILNAFTDGPTVYYKLCMFLKDVDRLVDQGDAKAIALQKQITEFSRLLDLVKTMNV